jgi:hypothetical protein
MRLASLLPSSCAAALLVSLAATGTTSPALAAKCPNVHIVLDRSGSMSSTSGTGTRWTVAKAAIESLLQKYDNKFPIGMSIFPSVSCDSQLVTEPAYKSKAAIQAAINASGPSGGTPSGTAMYDARQLKGLKEPDREQFVILITDGGPSCGAMDSCPGTAAEIDNALKQSPSISTFVVGFGGGLSASEQACMTQMAVAGGKPAASAEKFYKADNAADLEKALGEIIKVVGGGGDVGMSGFCDDTCYSNGCKVVGEVCVAGECKPNPCAGVVCPPDQFCFTDGLSAGVCTKACTKQCPQKTRCSLGNCISDPCPNACPAGTVCDASAKRCVVDPLCGSMLPDEACKGTSACRGGKCIDDPCRYISCPTGTRCIPWEGTCDWLPPPPDDEMMETEEDSGATVRRSGCSTIPGGAGVASFGVAALYFVALLAARRRRRS